MCSFSCARGPSARHPTFPRSIQRALSPPRCRIRVATKIESHQGFCRRSRRCEIVRGRSAPVASPFLFFSTTSNSCNSFKPEPPKTPSANMAVAFLSHFGGCSSSRRFCQVPPCLQEEKSTTTKIPYGSVKQKGPILRCTIVRHQFAEILRTST